MSEVKDLSSYRYVFNCVYCGKEFGASNPRAIKCGKRCGDLARAKSRGGKGYGKKVKKREDNSLSNINVYSFSCVLCGDTHEAKVGNKKYCSKESCVKERQRRRNFSYLSNNPSANILREEARERKNARGRAYAQENRDRLIEEKKKWRSKNPNKVEDQRIRSRGNEGIKKSLANSLDALMQIRNNTSINNEGS